MKSKLNLFVKAALAIFAVFAIITVMTLRSKLDDLEVQKKELESQLEEYAEKVEKMRYELSLSDEEYIEIFTSPDAFSDVLEAIEKAGAKIVESDVRQIANMKKELTEEEEEKMQNFLDRMDENDDVQNVWHNADM